MRPARAVAASVVAALVAGACSSGGSWPGEETERDRSDDDVDRSLAVPTELRARLGSDDPDALLEISFRPSPDADLHRLDFDGDSEPVPVTSRDCSDDSCRVALDRLSVAGDTSLTVAAVVGDRRSAASEPVDVPEWPDPDPPPAPGEDGPVTLVVVRAGGEGAPTVETEQVAAGEAEARMAELDADPAVLGVQVNGTIEDSQDSQDSQEGDAEEQQEASEPEQDISALLTWYAEALDYDQLPPEPRGEGVTVAVIDGGVDTGHPAFAGADVETIPMTDRGVVPDHHGTSVTSLIAASPDSPVPGIASGATIRNYDIKGGGDGPDVAAGIRAIVAAVDDGADVINISWVESCNSLGPLPVHVACEPDGLQAAVEYAEQHGVVVVAGAGNDGDGEGCDHDDTLGPNEDHWPAKFPTVVAVGATSPGGDTWSCSPDKDYIDVLAPGSQVLVASNELVDGGYASVSGTSYAAPLVSGLVALILAEQPDLTPAEVRAMLARATDENGRVVPGVIMAELGVVPEGGFVDPGTAQAVYPYTLELQLRSGHPAQEAGRAVEDAWMQPPMDGSSFDVSGLSDEAWGAPANQDEDGSSLHVTVRGTLFVEEDGSLTGYGTMDSLGDEIDLETETGDGNGVRVGHQVACPQPEERDLSPYILFGWSVPAVVGGHLSTENGRADVELSLSLGQGATADEAGELPPITVLHDNLDDCPAFLGAAPEGWNTCRLPPCIDSWHLCEDLSPDACWSEVDRARADLVDLTETLYQEVIDVGTVHLEDENIGLDDGIGTLQTSTDDMRISLTIGT